MDVDLRPLIVLGPIILVAAWATYNMAKAVMSGETKLFGSRGNKFW